MANIINAATTGTSGLVTTADASGIVQFQTSGSATLTINASGAIGTGVTPAYGTAGQVLTSAGTGAVPTWTSSLSNLTLTNPTITNYIETVNAPAAGTAFTVDLTTGTIQKLTSSGNLTITLPTSVAGKSYIIIVAYGGAHSLTWAGGSTIKWAGGTAPTATSVSGKFDIFSFFCDGTNTYGQTIGANF